MRHALVCMTAYYLLAGIGLCDGGDMLSALEPFYFHVSPRCWRFFVCLVVGVGFVFGLCFLGSVVCLCCCVLASLVHHMLRHT